MSQSLVAPAVRSESYEPDRLIAGPFPIVTKTVTIASGANLSRGAVLGKITASGKYKLSASASGDGSQTPTVILADNAPAASADVIAPVYLSGEFDAAELTFGAGVTAASAEDGLRALSIFLKTSVPAVP